MPIEVMLFTRHDCPNCPQAKKLVQRLVDELGDQVTLEEFDLDEEEDLLTALQHQVMSTPAVVVQGRLVAAGGTITREDVVEAIQSVQTDE